MEAKTTHTHWELDEEPTEDGALLIIEGDDQESVIAVVSPSIGDDPNKRFPSFEYARLMRASPELYEALKDVNALIAEAAMTGFNWAHGDWAQRLYDSQQKTSAALSRVEQTGKRDEVGND